jgi:hypothetical protein
MCESTVDPVGNMLFRRYHDEADRDRFKHGGKFCASLLAFIADGDALDRAFLG